MIEGLREQLLCKALTCHQRIRTILAQAWASGGTGRRVRLKIAFQQWSEGSSPSPPTRNY